MCGSWRSSRTGLKPSTQSECGRRKAGVDDGGFELKIEGQAIVDESLDMEWNLRAVDEAIAGEADFDGDIEASVVIWVDVESDCNGEERGRIKPNVRLGEKVQEK